MSDAVDRFIEWIVTTPLSLFLQSEEALTATLQTIHILCVAVVLSAAAMLDLKLLGFVGKDQSLPEMVRRYLPVAWVAVVILAITGGLLIIAEPVRELLALPFQLKMLMLVAVIILTVAFQRTVTTNAGRWDNPRAQPRGARITALVSLALWLSIIVAGRWIAYAEPHEIPVTETQTP
jgi:uncharacterized membrane protein